MIYMTVFWYYSNIFTSSHGRIIEKPPHFQNRMKFKKVILLILVSVSAYALDIYDDVANAIRSGDAKQVATFFGNSVELTIIDAENVFSHAQAELVLKDFFAKYPPKSFSILHKGSSPEGTQYAIGNLLTSNGKTFRTSYYLKNTNGKFLLQELRIENE
jgi:hypothetical protein